MFRQVVFYLYVFMGLALLCSKSTATINGNNSISSTTAVATTTTTPPSEENSLEEDDYDFDDSYLNDNDSDSDINVEAAIVEEIERRLPEFQQMQRDAITKFTEQNGMCNAKSREQNKQSYYDIDTGGCIECNRECPENDYFCFAMCASYRSSLAQSEANQKLQDQLNSLKFLVVAAIVILIFALIIFAVFIIRKWNQHNKRLKKISDRLNQAQLTSDDRPREETLLMNANGHANGHVNGHANGHANGHIVNMNVHRQNG